MFNSAEENALDIVYPSEIYMLDIDSVYSAYTDNEYNSDNNESEENIEPIFCNMVHLSDQELLPQNPYQKFEEQEATWRCKDWKLKM